MNTNRQNKLTVKRMVLIAALTCIALTIFVIESQIPPLVAVPGIKLGLANIITLFALVFLSPKDAFIILILRVLLGSMFSGQVMTLAYSLSGGIICLITETVLIKLVSTKFIWAISAVGAVVHNIIQITVAVLITSTPEIFWYIPYLTIAGIITGVFTGLCIQIIIQKSGKSIKKLIK